MILALSIKGTTAVAVALRDDDFEGAVEAVFEDHPEASRDDAVDTVEAIAEFKDHPDA